MKKKVVKKWTKVIKKPAKKVAKKIVKKKPAKKVAKKSAVKKRANLTPFLLKQRTHLIALRDQITGDIFDVGTESNNKKGVQSEKVGDDADMGSAAYDADFTFNLLAKEQKELEEINMALRKIEDATYGICEESKKKIPRKRLEFLPYARFTAECQEEREKGRGSSDSS